MTRKLMCIVDCDVCHDSEFTAEGRLYQTICPAAIDALVHANGWTHTADGRDLCPDCARKEADQSALSAAGRSQMEQEQGAEGYAEWEAGQEEGQP